MEYVLSVDKMGSPPTPPLTSGMKCGTVQWIMLRRLQHRLPELRQLHLH